MKDKILLIPVNKLGIDVMNSRGGAWTSDEDLISSIKQQGVLEPLIVRKAAGQKRKYPKHVIYTVVCGSRRYWAAREAKLKQVPCMIREIDDIGALGTSVQENLQREDIDAVTKAEMIKKMWDLLDKGKPYEEKIKFMYEKFGLRESRVKEFISISQLTERVKETFLKPTPAAGVPRLDTSSAAALAGAGIWKGKQQEEAAEILSKKESRKERLELLRKLKTYPELAPREAYAKIERIPQGRSYDVRFSGEVTRALDKACIKEKMNVVDLIIQAVEDWLRRQGYLTK